jgi:F-type H+-transporting ATPase subunit gamma
MAWDLPFSRFIQQFLSSVLFRATVESLVSENGSRLASIQGVERNIEEHYNFRQWSYQ